MNILPEDLANETEKPSSRGDLAEPPDARPAPSKYKPDPGLVDAIKVTLLLGKPLLLTGRPGTGKTDFGRYLAWKMGLPFEMFTAKSTSAARDPYYTYDAIRHFRSGDGAVRPYLTFNALGEAIKRCAVATNEVERLLPDFINAEPRQSVVVIDEIDKAPRDFPNDLLNEIDQKYFRIPEMENVKVEADKRKAPILIITSNSEKMLPTAFLRRCVYYDIEFPDEKTLRKIVIRRIDAFADPSGALLHSAVHQFSLLAKEDSGMLHPPGTAELLDWMRALVEFDADVTKDIQQQRQLVAQTFVALVKRLEDRKTAKNLLRLNE